MTHRQFNYVIGILSNEGRISPYMLFNQEVFFGSTVQAEAALQYIQDETNNPEYKIYKLGLLV